MEISQVSLHSKTSSRTGSIHLERESVESLNENSSKNVKPEKSKSSSLSGDSVSSTRKKRVSIGSIDKVENPPIQEVPAELDETVSKVKKNQIKPSPISESGNRKLAKKDEIGFIFESDRDSNSGKPYYLDGDPKMYSADKLEVRKNQKNDPEIKQAIQEFFSLYNFDSSGLLSKVDFMKVHMRMAYILRPDLKDPTKALELKKVIEADWKKDCRGKEKMTKEDLYDSLYELSDIWTPTTDKLEYVSFFEMLKILMTSSNDKSKNANLYDII